MEKIKAYWQDVFLEKCEQPEWWKRKFSLWEKQKGSIVKVEGKGEPYRTLRYDGKAGHEYILHLRYLIKQEEHYHMEEQVQHYRMALDDNEHVKHEEILPEPNSLLNEKAIVQLENESDESRQNFTYDRREAVRYAERWWNSYNPEFRVFADDCTNYISQCLLAGGAPMRGAPIRDQGWWYQGDNWSFSWAVAHSMRWYLSGSTAGLKGKEMESAEDLIPGDVICYDFQGDGRWDHTTIVVNKDAFGMPLVNAHTNNSRNRYWTYEDSAAWTPDIQYKFFRIGE